MTIAAALNLMALVLFSAANTDANTLILFAVCEFTFIMGAVLSWKKYFEDLIELKTNNGS